MIYQQLGLLFLFFASSFSSSAQLKVMSYNIRHDCTRTESRTCKTNERPLNDRIQGIKAIIDKYSPQVVGFQELENYFLKGTVKELFPTYNFFCYEQYSTVLMWEKKYWILTDSGGINLSPSHRKTSWVKLTRKSDSKEFLFVNSHFISSGNGTDEEREESSRILLKFVTEASSARVPIILLGDFNSKPSSEAISIIEADFQNIDPKGEQSTYSKNFNDIKKGKKLDYIFLSKNIYYKNYKVAKERDRFNLFPSDHLPIICEIQECIPYQKNHLSLDYSLNKGTEIKFSDITGDNKSDFLTWNHTKHKGRLKIYLAKGDGTFSDPITDPNGWSEKAETKYYFADVNGDGKDDKIFWRYNYNKGRLKIYLAKGDGTFSDPITDPNGWSEKAETKYYFADVNGDGKDDKIFWRYNYNKGRLKIYLAKGDGTFSDPITDPNGWSEKAETKYYFADVNGDGKDDKIFWRYNYNKGRLKIYLAKGDGTFSDPITDPNGWSEKAETKYYFADVNGDGKDDKIFWRYNYNNGKLRVFLAEDHPSCKN
jgi:endonuclease/exonuclease/phosphatase family metal-dependent hydrolase